MKTIMTFLLLAYFSVMMPSIFAQHEIIFSKADIHEMNEAVFELDKDMITEAFSQTIDSIVSQYTRKELKKITLVLEERTDYSWCCEDITRRRALNIQQRIQASSLKKVSSEIKIIRFKKSSKKSTYYSPKITFIFYLSS